MRVLKVELSIESILEKVYEYLISNCDKFFGVKNKNITFHIVPDQEKCTMLVAICREESISKCEVFCDDLLSSSKLDYYEHYKIYYWEEAVNVFTRCQGVELLPSNEFRYVNLNKNLIIKLAIDILAKLLDIGGQNVRVVKCSERDSFIFYYSKTYKCLTDIENASTNVIDYTMRVKDLFI